MNFCRRRFASGEGRELYLIQKEERDQSAAPRYAILSMPHVPAKSS